VQPDDRHWQILRSLIATAGTAGNLTSDAHLAALALAGGWTLVSTNQRVYIVHEGRRIDISAGGQWPLDAVVRNLLRRVHRGRHGIVMFFPRVAPPRRADMPEDEYAPIAVDPEVCFGRPVVAGTGIPTDVIADRYLGGDSVKKMAEDYDLSEEHIWAALRFERVLKADAA
jgi:uncharacterized protein (DUF433 family)